MLHSQHCIQRVEVSLTAKILLRIQEDKKPAFNRRNLCDFLGCKRKKSSRTKALPSVSFSISFINMRVQK